MYSAGGVHHYGLRITSSHLKEYPEGLTQGAPQQMVTNYVHRDQESIFCKKLGRKIAIWRK